MQQEMRYVYQVYLDGSFSKAAEHLFITQPALSIAIRKLEADLGMALFDRNSRPLTLTPAGEIYLAAVRQTLYLEQELQQQLADIRHLNSGSICIGGSHYINAYVLPDVITGFNHTYPGIKLQLLEASAARLAELLSRHELDLTFNCDEDLLGQFPHYPAFQDHILLAMPADHPLNAALAEAALTTEAVLQGAHLQADCPAVSLDRFQEVEFLLLTEGNNLHERSKKLFAQAGYAPKVKMELGQLATAFHLAEHGLAATFVSDRLLSRGAERLCYYKLASPLATRQFFILLPPRRYTSFAVRAFIRYFTKQI